MMTAFTTVKGVSTYDARTAQAGRCIQAAAGSAPATRRRPRSRPPPAGSSSHDGPDALTLRAIAREMGMTAPALYRYFGSHEDLVVAVCQTCSTS